MITIVNGSHYARIDETSFALLQKRGRYKGWKKLETLSDVLYEELKAVDKIPSYSSMTVSEIKALLEKKCVPYRKGCKDKKLLYNILINV